MKKFLIPALALMVLSFTACTKKTVVSKEDLATELTKVNANQEAIQKMQGELEADHAKMAEAHSKMVEEMTAKMKGKVMKPADKAMQAKGDSEFAAKAAAHQKMVDEHKNIASLYSGVVIGYTDLVAKNPKGISEGDSAVAKHKMLWAESDSLFNLHTTMATQAMEANKAAEMPAKTEGKMEAKPAEAKK